MRRLHAVAVLCALAFAAIGRLTAHEIPQDVVVQAFVRTEPQRLRVLMRVPLHAMRDIQFPQIGVGLLDIDRADQSIRNAAVQWLVPAVELREGDVPLPPPDLVSARVSLPSDRSFVSYDAALANMSAPRLAADTQLPWDQAMLDVLLEYPIQSARSRFSIVPGFARLGLRVVTVLRFVTPDGSVRAFEYRGDPGLVHLDPRWHQAAWHFVKLGFTHILDGIDHLLFLVCLVIPFRRLRPLIVVVTAFTVAHSITLIASAYDLAPSTLWFPPLIETLIAASIVYMAIENIVRPARASRRWVMAFAFGLVHGFGFSFALKETLQFAGAHLVTSLLSFNIGVELGQILVLIVLVPVLQAVFRHVVADRLGTIVLSAIVAHTAWHWMWERWSVLRQFPLSPIDAALFAVLLRWTIGLVAAAALLWLFGRLRARATPNTTPSAASPVTQTTDARVAERPEITGATEEGRKSFF